MSLAKDGISQKIYPATVKRVQDRAAKIRAADPLGRTVSFDQAVNWMCDKLDQIDKTTSGRTESYDHTD